MTTVRPLFFAPANRPEWMWWPPNTASRGLGLRQRAFHASRTVA